MSGLIFGDGAANFAIDSNSEIIKRIVKRTVNGFPAEMHLSVGDLLLSGQHYSDLLILEIDYSESEKAIRSRMGNRPGDQYGRDCAEEAEKLAEEHCKMCDLKVVRKFQHHPSLKYMVKKK